MSDFSKTKGEGYRFAGWHYSLIQILYWMLICCYYVYGASYLFELGLDGSATGVILALIGALSALVQSLAASAADRRGGESAKWISVMFAVPVCVLLAALSFFGLSKWPGVVIYAMVWILVMALQFLISSLGMDAAKAGLRVNFGVSRAYGSMFYALTAYLLGIICASSGVHITVPIAAGISLLLLVSLLLWRVPERVEEPDDEKNKDALGGTGFFSRYPRFAVFVAGTTLCLIAYCITCNYLVRIVEALGGGSRELGSTVMITAISEIPTILISVWLNKKFGSNKLLMTAAALLSVRMVLVALAPSITALYAVMLMQIISYSLFIPASVYYVDALMQERDRLKGQAMMTLIPTAGNSLGSLLGGFLLDTVQVRGMLVCCVIISVIGSVIMIYGTQKGDMRQK